MKKVKRIKQFIHTKEAWYAESALKNRQGNIADEILIFVGPDVHNNGCDYEFSIKWHNIGTLNGDSSPVARVEIFEDSLKAFTEFKDLFKELSKLHDKNPTVEQVIEILKKLKYKDETKREVE